MSLLTRSRWIALSALAGMLTVGCAASVRGDRDAAMDGGASDGASEDAGRDVRYRDVPDPLPDTFVDPVCADAATSIRAYNCDPFNSRATCPVGEGCYPFIEYPMGRCLREIYHADCIPEGTIPVGQPCGSGGACVAGATCFATGAGTRCLQLCRVDGTAPQCPRGAVCEPTDSPEIGACD